MNQKRLKKIIFFNDYATSQLKIPGYHRLLSDLHHRIWLNDIRGYVPIEDQYDVLCSSIEKMLKLPFEPHVIVTSGATEALAIATKTLRPTIVDIYSHNSIVCNLDIVPQVFYVEDKMKVFDSEGNSIGINTYPELDLSEYECITITSEPSFLPAGTSLAHHSKLFVREKVTPDKTVIVDYSQSAIWAIETDPFIEELYERNYKFCMAFGLHKKLGMYPGTGFLIWPREHEFNFKRLYRGGGGKDPFFTPYSGYFQAGTFDYAIINMLYLLSDKDRNLYSRRTSKEEGNILDFTTELLLTLEQRNETFLIQDLPEKNSSEPDKTCITIVDNEQVSQLILDISELQNIKVVSRSGKMCCDLFFDTVRNHNLFETKEPFDSYARFSCQHLQLFPQYYPELPDDMIIVDRNHTG